ncbi:MAG: carbohydrate kinase family protein [Bacteroides sp.]|nr:carbohydrate kinase family protein [Bacteroides sp.]
MKDFNVLVVGELNIDLILNKIEGFPQMGKEILADEMTVTLGSSSAIFANNLSRLGARVSYLGKVGNDQFAKQVFSTLEDAGVHTGNIIVSPDFQTGLTVAMNYDNDRAMVTYPGAMNDLRFEDISDVALQSASHLHVSSIFLQPGLKPDIITLFRRAKEAGLTTSFDPQWDPHEKWDVDLKDLLPHVDVFLPNASELEQFTGCGSIEESIKKIQPYCHVVVVKNGVKGASMWDGSRLVSQDAFLNTSVVDAIGAGDSFNSGFIRKFTGGNALPECLEFAALCGAINTTGAGGTSAFQSPDGIKSVALEQFNFKL